MSHQINQNDSTNLLIEQLINENQKLKDKLNLNVNIQNRYKIVDYDNKTFGVYPEIQYPYVKLLCRMLNTTGNYKIIEIE